MKNKLCRSVSVRPGSMDLRIDSADPVLYLCDTEVEETRKDSDVKVHKDECKIINGEESGAVKVLALFISFSRCSSKRGRTGEHYCRYCRHNKRYSQFYKQKSRVMNNKHIEN